MTPPELAARLHEIADAAERRTTALEREARESGYPDDESIRIALGALRDDALILHTTAEAIDATAVSLPTAMGILAERAGELFEQRRQQP